MNFQNIEDGKTYNLVMYVKSPRTAHLTVSLTSSDGSQNLASVTIMFVAFLSTMLTSEEDLWLSRYSPCYNIAFCRVAGKSDWIKVEQKLVAEGTNRTSRLQITSHKKGVVWFDQVSLMPADTYKVYYVSVGELHI